MTNILFKSVSDYKNFVLTKLSDLKIVTEGTLYFTVSDTDGYKAYFQVDSFQSADIPSGFQSACFATVHKANPSSGAGRVVVKKDRLSLDEFKECLYATLAESRSDILSGHEKNC